MTGNAQEVSHHHVSRYPFSFSCVPTLYCNVNANEGFFTPKKVGFGVDLEQNFWRIL